MELSDIKTADIKFRRFHFWSDWVDMGMFNFCSRGYLMQMSVNRFNKKRFLAIKLSRTFQLAHPLCQQVLNKKVVI